MSDRGWRFCGNRQAVNKLRTAIRLGAPRHAFLFTGMSSLGKRTLALRFAQSLLCEQPTEDGSPCFACGSCRRAQRGMHPDVTIFSLESQNAQLSGKGGKGTTLTIDTAREISSQAPLRPMNGRWRIVIIDDAELLLPDAQEALLKTIEEPPLFLIIVLIATGQEAILPTIRSRCEVIEFGIVPISEIEGYLIDQGVQPQIAEAAAAFSGGIPGWAIRACEDPGLIEESAATMDQAAAWIDSTDFERVATAFALAEVFNRKRGDSIAVVEAAAGLWRDSLLVRTDNSSKIVYRAHSDLTDRLAGSHELSELLEALSSVWTCLDDLRINVRPRLALESMVLSWPRMPAHR